MTLKLSPYLNAGFNPSRPTIKETYLAFSLFFLSFSVSYMLLCMQKILTVKKSHHVTLLHHLCHVANLAWGGYTEGDNTAAALDIMRKQILSTKACKHIRLVTQNKKMNPKKSDCNTTLVCVPESSTRFL